MPPSLSALVPACPGERASAWSREIPAFAAKGWEAAGTVRWSQLSGRSGACGARHEVMLSSAARVCAWRPVRTAPPPLALGKQLKSHA